MNAALAVEIADASGVGEAKRTAAAAARGLGFDETAAAYLAIVVTELASNLVKHGGGGLLVIQRQAWPEAPCVELLALDRGPGIRDLGASLRDGYSTAGSPGTGLGAVRRLSSLFDVYAPPGRGAAVLSRICAQAPPPPPPARPLTVGAVSLARRDETACGDAWTVHQAAGRALLLVADGLGHGEPAATAAGLAVQVFRTRCADRPEDMVAALDVALHATRGAALAVAEVLPGVGVVHYAGLGNVAARIYGEAPMRSLVSTEGTAGAGMHRAHAYTYPWPADGILVMSSDGLTRHWDLDDYPGLRSRHPSLIAGVLLRDARRERDDVTVLVATCAAEGS